MFYRQKNRRLADLRMIDDQIKSDCMFFFSFPICSQILVLSAINFVIRKSGKRPPISATKSIKHPLSDKCPLRIQIRTNLDITINQTLFLCLQVLLRIAQWKIWTTRYLILDVLAKVQKYF